MLHEHVIGALQRARQKAIVGVEEIDRFDAFPGPEDVLDAGIARGAQPAIGAPDVEDAIWRRRDKIEAGLMRFRHRAAVIDDDDDELEIGLLIERRGYRFAE